MLHVPEIGIDDRDALFLVDEFCLVMKNSDVVLFRNLEVGNALFESLSRSTAENIWLDWATLRYSDRASATVFRDFLDTIWR